MNQTIPLNCFSPVSMLQSELNLKKTSKFPTIDAHNHLGNTFGHPWADKPVLELLSHMDFLNIQAIIDLDGGFAMDTLKLHLKHFKQQAPERFIHFGGIDFNILQKGDKAFQTHVNNQLEELKELGAQGLKVWKNLGLKFKDSSGRLLRINDKRLHVLWSKAAELDFPIMIHVADPLAFFYPIDKYNERYEELHAHPEWHFPPENFPSFNQIIDDFFQMIHNNPSTTFIGAHLGCYAENLKRVSQVLDSCPNFYVDTSARLAELGRQPYSSRDFFLKYHNRILFGTDMGMERAVYQNYFRFFETKDEYFNYDSAPIPSQGRWSIYGIDLPDSVLKNVYSENIKRILKIS